jgi:hypothetical protein
MAKLTYDEINALNGTDLNEAVARADGWTRKKITDFGLMWVNGNEFHYSLPDYRNADRLDRMTLEIKGNSTILLTLYEDMFAIKVWITSENLVIFKSESLTTAILRAFLWYRQEQVS